MFAVIIVYSVFGYKMFQFLLFKMSMLDNWIDNRDKVTFHEYEPGMMLIRFFYFLIIFLIITPLLLMKNLDKMKPIANLFLLTMVLVIIVILIEGSFFRSFYISSPDKEYKYEAFMTTPSIVWIVTFFQILLSFYVQPFVLELRKQLLKPSFKRLKKVAAYSVFTEMGIYLVFASFCYFCFGDNFTADLIYIREPYPGKNKFSEFIFTLMISFFWILTNISLCVYNPGIRKYVAKFVQLKNEKLSYAIQSLGAYLCGFITAFIYPDILGIFWIIGLIVCNFNGFIIPALMKLEVLKRKNGLKIKIWGTRALICFFITCGCVGVFFNVFLKNNGVNPEAN